MRGREALGQYGALLGWIADQEARLADLVGRTQSMMLEILHMRMRLRQDPVARLSTRQFRQVEVCIPSSAHDEVFEVLRCQRTLVESAISHDLAARVYAFVSQQQWRRCGHAAVSWLELLIAFDQQFPTVRDEQQ
eukprot:2735821-Alexandrium_andersonii.AAC.1